MDDPPKEDKPETSIPIPQSSHEGIVEHFCRAAMFLNAAMRTSDNVARFRLLLAAAYSCRAIAELMLEETAQDRDELTVNREELIALLTARLPYFKLIERIRIQDFHRYGITPPIAGGTMVMYRGPTTLKAGGTGPGSACIQIGPNGPQVHCTGTGKVVERRALVSANGCFFDEATKQYVSLQKVIREYLIAVPAMTEKFNKLYKNASGHKPYQGDLVAENDEFVDNASSTAPVELTKEDAANDANQLMSMAAETSGLPADLATNHDHYLHGLPKQ